MDKTEHEILEGQHAAQLLADPLLVSAFVEIEQEYTDAWLQSPVRDYEGREELYRLLKSLHAVRARIAQKVDNGKVAQATLAQRLGQMLNPFSS